MFIGLRNHSLLRHERQHKSFKKYKIQVHNKNTQNRGLRNREQENPTAIYRPKYREIEISKFSTIVTLYLLLVYLVCIVFHFVCFY